MRIAAIDYGESIGLAIAEIRASLKDIFLDEYCCGTFINGAGPVLEFVASSRAHKVILERLAPNPTSIAKQSVEIYHLLHDGLLTMEFKGATFADTGKSLTLVSPSQWKPIVAAMPAAQEFGTWHAETQHEKDAMSMLWYVVQIHNQNKVVRYA